VTAVLKLAWIFFKIGLIFFGGGYVLIPLLHRIMVDQLRILTLPEFLDGMALSQLTPGPLAILATFVGFKGGGIAGALAATIAIFLPCMLLMLFLASRYRHLRNVELVKGALDGIIPSVVGLVAAAAWTLGSTSLTGPGDYLLLAGAFLVLQFTRTSPMFLILGAAAAGFFFGLG
jgi:chromate transporter